MTAQGAMEFVLSCLNELEADGYQCREDDSGEVPSGSVPDEFSHDGKRTIFLRFGNDHFEVVVKKKRKQ